MVDIAEYRYRIGSFRRKSFDIDVTTLNVIGVVGFIGILLFMAGVELNPGPGSIQVLCMNFLTLSYPKSLVLSHMGSKTWSPWLSENACLIFLVVSDSQTTT